MRAFSLILSCLLLSTPLCRGQEYFFVRYTQKDGLINGRARFISQDSRGRLYISTFGGLSVYDGSRFTNYNTENGLSTSLVNDIVELGEDSLLIVPNSRALHLMVRGSIRDVHTTDQYYPITNQLIRTANGEFYAIADDGLFRYREQRFEKLKMIADNGAEAGPFLVGAVESGRKLFIVTDPFLYSNPGTASLLIYDLDTHRLLTAHGPDRFLAVTRSPSGEVYLITGNGVRILDRAALEKGVVKILPPPPPYAAAADIRGVSLVFDRDAGLWLSTGKELTRIDAAGNITRIGAGEGLPAGTINTVFEDRERNIWLTNTQNGIARLVSGQVRYFGSAAPRFTVTDLSADPSTDSVWCYDQGRHDLLLLTGGGTKRFHTDDPLPATGHIQFGKQAWLTAPAGIYKLSFIPGTDRFGATLVFRDSSMLDGRSCLDRDGRLVLASNRLVVLGDGRIWEQEIPSHCDQAAVDRQNRIWAISRGDSLMLFTPDTTPGSGALKRIASWPRIRARSPRSICIDSRGRVWIGTRDRGLFCLEFDGLKLRSYRQFTIDNGLSEDFIWYLYGGSDNAVWAGTPSGLDKIQWKSDSFSITNITPGHELGILDIRESANGTHWALVNGGYLRIEKAAPVADSKGPAVLFSQVLVGNLPVSADLRQPMSLAHDRNAVSFYVGVPSFMDEDQIRYSYLLEGSGEAAWSPPSRQSAMNFVNLPPGKYILRVKAKFLSGTYPDTLGSYPFIIRPPWWQTLVFRIIALVFLSLLVGWGIRRYTLNRLKAQRILLERQQAIEKERTRIATDMHDDLGAGLSRIKFLSDTIGIKQQRRMPIDEEIDGIREYSKEMIDKMGEIVWALNQKHDLLSDLLSYTRSYAAAYLMQASIVARIDAPEEFPYAVVSGEFRRNVYLAVKEALHNIVKHSRAQEVFIYIAVDRELVILLRDDGVGFDRSRIRPYANGLLNMERRIRELGGRLEIDSGGQGTALTIVVPV